MNIFWINTTYYPAPGGGAVYIKILSESLKKIDKVEHIEVFAEAYPKTTKLKSDGKLQINRIFPYRSGADKKGISSFFKYGMQNIALLMMPLLAKKSKPDIVVFHSWYFIHPSVVSFIVNRLKKQNIKLVADMRDVSLELSQFKRLYKFDALICCGLRVLNHYKQDPILASKLHYIPIPFETINVTQLEVDSMLKRLRIKENKFIFSPSGVTNAKRFSLIFDAWKVLLDQGFHVDLVVAGRNRDWKDRYNICHSNGKLILAGSLMRHEIHSLYKAAALSLNVSKREGLPRVPLEAMHHNKPLLFPPNTPEFDLNFPKGQICDTDSPIELADKIKQSIEKGIKYTNMYDVSVHSPKKAALKTFSVFEALLYRNK